MSFEVLLKTESRVESDESLYYLVAANGVFQIRNTPAYYAVTFSEGEIPGLVPETEMLRLRCPPLSAEWTDEVLAFFDAVFQRWKGEAIVVLFYRPETHEYLVRAPTQRIERYRSRGAWVTEHHLDYDYVERPEGYLRFGTIHSHASSPAYASYTDCADERYEDGLHIVVGDLQRDEQSRSAAFVANGRRFPLDPDRVFPSRPLPKKSARREWLEQVEVVEVEPPVYAPFAAWWSG